MVCGADRKAQPPLCFNSQIFAFGRGAVFVKTEANQTYGTDAAVAAMTILRRIRLRWSVPLCLFEHVTVSRAEPSRAEPAA